MAARHPPHHGGAHGDATPLVDPGVEPVSLAGLTHADGTHYVYDPQVYDAWLQSDYWVEPRP
jgi:hypothetical protein